MAPETAMNTTKGRPPVEIERSVRAHLDSIRHAAHQRLNPYQLLGEYDGKDPLERLAWATGLFRGHPDSLDVIGGIITYARQDNRKWREIAVAMGEGDNDMDARRVMKRYLRWAETQ